jgi:hypothetical protein
MSFLPDDAKGQRLIILLFSGVHRSSSQRLKEAQVIEAILKLNINRCRWVPV